MIEAIQNFVRTTDAAVARMYLGLFRERNALLTFLFHSLFRDEREIARNHVDPLERTTIRQFRGLIEYYLHHGYRFLSPDDLLDGHPADGKFALLTFDDGYYNNSLALPILEEYNVPALFFISTNHVQQNKCFWWDVQYRELLAKGASPRHAYREGLALKSLRTEEIERQLTARFGVDAFTPRSDIDRPFTPSELRQFASSPHVHLGNHTSNHAILTNYEPLEIRRQVQGAQDALFEMTGVRPSAIAYPNGAHDREVVSACSELGLKLGFTIRPEKNVLPLAEGMSSRLRLGRFVPEGGRLIEEQCRTYRSDLQMYQKFRDGYLWLMRGKVGQ